MVDETMSDDNFSGGCLIIAFAILFSVLVGITIDSIFYLPARIEAVETQFRYDNISVQEVTINSPTVYIELDDYDEFKEVLHDLNSSVIYSERSFYYIFDEDYTVAWRIHVNTIYQEIKTQ